MGAIPRGDLQPDLLKELGRTVADADGPATGRGIPRPQALDPNNFNRVLPNAPYLGFLEPLPALLADSERRVKQGKVQRVLELGVEQFPDKQKQIAAMIRDLEAVSARQCGQPGGVDLQQDEIVRALIGEGEDAVDPPRSRRRCTSSTRLMPRPRRSSPRPPSSLGCRIEPSGRQRRC